MPTATDVAADEALLREALEYLDGFIDDEVLGTSLYDEAKADVEAARHALVRLVKAARSDG